MPLVQQTYGDPLSDGLATLFGFDLNRAEAYKYNPDAFKYQNADQRQRQIAQEILKSQQERTPTIRASQIDNVPQQQFRQNQLGMGQQIQQDLNAPQTRYASTIADNILKTATDRGIKQNLALAATSRGGANPGGVARTMATQNANMQQEAAQQAVTTGAQVALQEDQALRQNRLAQQQAAAQIASQGRGQDIQLAGENAQLSQQANISNQSTEVQQRQLRDTMVRDLMSKGLGIDQAIMQANQRLEELRGQADASAMGVNAKIEEEQAKKWGNITGSAISSIGTAIAASDVSLKEDIDYEGGTKEIDRFLSSLKPAKYKYKDERYGKGEQLSVMAQQLEKSAPGKKAVFEVGGKKMVDYVKLLPTILAAEATLHKRLSKIERKR